MRASLAGPHGPQSPGVGLKFLVCHYGRMVFLRDFQRNLKTRLEGIEYTDWQSRDWQAQLKISFREPPWAPRAGQPIRKITSFHEFFPGWSPRAWPRMVSPARLDDQSIFDGRPYAFCTTTPGAPGPRLSKIHKTFEVRDPTIS